jgi:hypothetical protein
VELIFVKTLAKEVFPESICPKMPKITLYFGTYIDIERILGIYLLDFLLREVYVRIDRFFHLINFIKLLYISSNNFINSKINKNGKHALIMLKSR